MIATTISGGVRQSWTGEPDLSTECLTPDYHLLYLAIVACITPTATKKLLPGWMARVLYGVDTGQRIYLVRLYIKMFTEPSRSTSPSMQLKGAWAIHRLYEVAQILVDPTDIP